MVTENGVKIARVIITCHRSPTMSGKERGHNIFILMVRILLSFRILLNFPPEFSKYKKLKNPKNLKIKSVLNKRNKKKQ